MQAELSKASQKLIRIGHSPDPDDAFMFYALAKNKIPMGNFRVEHVIEDIETLNQRAANVGAYRPPKSSDGSADVLVADDTPLLEVTAVSCHAYAYMADKYLVLRSGASVGDKYGPVLVGRGGSRTAPTLRHKRIAVPGKLTTAYLTLQLYEKDFEPVFVPFDQILDAVESGKTDLGLVIHEGQITYKERGLAKVLDLGEWWHEETGLPLPLGIDVIRRDLGEDTILQFAKLFRQSIEYALAHRQEALEYALQFGRGIGAELGDRFVAMYVNDFTLDLGIKGEKGLERLFELASRKGLLPHGVQPQFADPSRTVSS